MQIRDITVQDLFKNTFEVPKFQRKFVWRSSEIEELIDDTLNAACSRTNNFLGSIVVKDLGQNPSGMDSGARKYDIIDGQQRITSISLIYRYIYILLKDKDHPLMPVHAMNVWDFQNGTEGAYVKKLIPSENIKAVYEKILDINWEYGDYPSSPLKNMVKILKPLMSTIKSRIDKIYHDSTDPNQLNSEFSAFLNKLSQSKFSFIVVQDDAEAMDVFERINTRGTDLTVADLLKNHLYKQYSNFGEFEENEFEEKWKKIEKFCGKNVNIPKMLKYFCISNYGKEGKINNKQIFTKLKKYISDNSLNRFMDELTLYSEYFNVCSSGDGNFQEIQKFLINLGFSNENIDGLQFNTVDTERIAIHWNVLSKLKIKQYIPLLYTIFSSYLEYVSQKPTKTRDAKKDIILLIKSLATYHYIYNGIQTTATNVVEALYVDYALKFKKSGESTRNIKTDLINEINHLKNNPTENSEAEEVKNTFIVEFIQLTYSDKKDLPLINYFFHYFYNEDNSAVSVPYNIYDYYKDSSDRMNSIEHISSRTVQEGEIQLDSESLNNIGNLMSLDRRVNGDLQNEPVSEKIRIFCETVEYGRIPNSYTILKEIYEDNNCLWDASLVQKRASLLAGKAFELLF